MEEKISVIVPVYGVEPYLRKCLDSLAGQTHRNLEIILVDDGSPDGCPAICDEYAARDSRFRVIHKENGGVSSARNAGLAAATGEWIGWVDPDDWVEPDMYRYLLAGIERAGADIAACGIKVVAEGNAVLVQYTGERIFDREEGLQDILEDRQMILSCVNKLFRRALWEGITFPCLKTAEDVSVLWRVLSHAERSVCLPEAKYINNRREGSLTRTGPLGVWLDAYNANAEQHRLMAEEWPQFQPVLARNRLGVAMMVWLACGQAPRREREAAMPRLQEISRECRPYLKEVSADRKLKPGKRLAIRLVAYPTGWAVSIGGLAAKLYTMKHGRLL